MRGEVVLADPDKLQGVLEVTAAADGLGGVIGDLLFEGLCVGWRGCISIVYGGAEVTSAI